MDQLHGSAGVWTYTHRQIATDIADSFLAEAERLGAACKDHGLPVFYYLDAISAIELGREVEALSMLSRLERLVLDLELAKASEGEERSREMGRLLCSSEPGVAFGARAELVAHRFLREDVLALREATLVWEDKPDFMLTTSDGVLKVEVTHAQVTGRRDHPLTYKVRQKIAEKARKPYAGLDTLVKVDVTGVYFADSLGGWDTGPDLVDGARQELAISCLGGALVIYSGATIVGDLETRYVPVVSSRGSGALCSFVAKAYPVAPAGYGVRLFRTP